MEMIKQRTLKFKLSAILKLQYLLLLIALNYSCKKTIDTNIESEKGSTITNGFSIENTWLLNRGLVNVESIIYDSKNQLFYASNGIDYKIGNDGFISKISKNGELLKLKWIKELNRPTGMAIFGNLLYVADVNALIIIDIRNGKVVQKLLEPIENSGLNDVAINENGEIFVTASFTNSIYYVDKGKLKPWINNDEKLKWANGIIAENERIIVAGMQLSTININSKKIDIVNLSPQIEDFDGIVSDGLGNYFLTTVSRNAIWNLKGKQIIKLAEDDSYFGDLEFIPELNKLYIPRGNQKEDQFFISVIELN